MSDISREDPMVDLILIDNLQKHENYREQFDKEEFVVTDEMWEEYIKNYDPRAFKDMDKNK